MFFNQEKKNGEQYLLLVEHIIRGLLVLVPSSQYEVQELLDVKHLKLSRGCKYQTDAQNEAN